MSSAQPPPQYTGAQHPGAPYPGTQQPGAQYPAAQYPGAPQHAAGGTDPYARPPGSAAGSDQVTAQYAPGSTAAGAHGPGAQEEHRDVSGTSVGTLLGDVTRDLSTLMRQELALAQAELRQEVAKTAKGAGALTGAGLAGYFVLLFLSIALWSGLSNIMDAGWAGLLVAVLWGVIAAVLFVVGRGQLRRVNPKPERTVDTLGQVPEALRPGHHPNAGTNPGGHR